MLQPPTLEEYNSIEYIPIERVIFCKEIYKQRFDNCIKEINDKYNQFLFMNEWHQFDEDTNCYYNNLKAFLLIK